MFADIFVEYTTIISSAILATLAVMLLVLRLPKKPEYEKIRIAKTCQALALSAIVTINVFKLTVAFGAANPDKDFVLGIIVNLTITLLAFTTIYIFIAPHSVSRRWLSWQIALIVAITAVSITTLTAVTNSDVTDACYIFMLVANVLQICYYTYMFHNRLPHHIAYLHQHGITTETRLRWIKWTFWGEIICAVAGVVFCIILLTKPGMEASLIAAGVLQICYTPYSVYLTARIYSYCVRSSAIVTLVYEDTYRETVTDNVPAADIKFRRTLDQWVADKKYLQKDIVLEDFAEQLNTTPHYIYYYFRTYLHNNFRTWRSELRVREAEKLLVEHPDLSYDKIAEMVGFNHRSNFFQQFQKVTGKKPSDLRKNG